MEFIDFLPAEPHYRASRLRWGCGEKFEDHSSLKAHLDSRADCTRLLIAIEQTVEMTAKIYIRSLETLQQSKIRVISATACCEDVERSPSPILELVDLGSPPSTESDDDGVVDGGPEGQQAGVDFRSFPNRGFILDSANRSRPSSNDSDGSSVSKRIMKRSATFQCFQCSLCPKWFMCPYNLRSHLRTHTDERPFVCTVCGKAFARQHDRQRHEGLHSNRKVFKCSGRLKNGQPWGCGRRFARVDGLGRHFLSEAGRVCIKPLHDEEAAEQMEITNDMTLGMVTQSFMQQPHSGF